MLVACLAASVGCATVAGDHTARSLAFELEELDLARRVVPFELDETMREWLAGAPWPRRDDGEMLSVLAERLLSDRGLGIRYDRAVTATAPEVFRERVGNCLTFTHLFAGMARELGVDVYFLEVRDLESYDRADDLIVHSDHIAIGFGPRHQMRIIDFAAGFDPDYHRVRKLTDRDAVGLYYSNRGAEFLRNGDFESARRWLRDAVRIAPRLAAPWVNLGVAERRLGDWRAAEAAYNRALELDDREGAAYQNLAALLRIRGDAEGAFALLAEVDRAGGRNPFSFLALGDLSVERRQLEEAERYYRRALRTDRGWSEPMAALGLVALERGDTRGARRWLRRALRAEAADHPRVAVLERRLGGSSSEESIPR